MGGNFWGCGYIFGIDFGDGCSDIYLYTKLSGCIY